MSRSSRRRVRIAAQVVLVIALAAGVVALGNFAYNASKNAASVSAVHEAASEGAPAEGRLRASFADAMYRHELLNWDAAAALASLVLVLGSAVVMRKHRSRRRSGRSGQVASKQVPGLKSAGIDT